MQKDENGLLLDTKYIRVYFNGFGSWLFGVENHPRMKCLYILFLCFGIVFDYSQIRNVKNERDIA